MSGNVSVTVGSGGNVTATTGQGTPTSDTTIQVKWDALSDANRNTFVDNNTFAIITHIYDSANATAVIARMTSPVIAEEAAMSKFVTLLGGLWDLADDFHHYGVQTETNALTGWKMKMLTAVNAPTHTPGSGYAFAVDQYINSNYNPNADGVKFILLDALIGVYLNNRISGTSMGGAVVGADQTAFYVDGVGMRGIINNADTRLSQQYQNDSLYITIKNASNNQIYERGLLIDSETDAAGSVVNVPLFIAARNLNGTPQLFFEGTLSSWIVGAAIGFDHLLYKVQLDKLNSDLAAI